MSRPADAATQHGEADGDWTAPLPGPDDGFVADDQPRDKLSQGERKDAGSAAAAERPDWPVHSGDRPDLGSGPAIHPDELDEWMIRETFVRCSTCKGSGLGGECECGGTGFDWGHTDEVRALLTKMMEEAESRG